MEFSLHRQLKALYALGDARTEVRVDRFRIDVVRGEELIEIQHGSLAALRRKLTVLLAAHPVRVVKPIVLRKRLVKCRSKDGPVAETRFSPRRGTLLDVFDELVYFGGLFPHPRLTLDIVLADIEEWRYPGRGRRRRARRGAFQTADQKLLEVHEIRSLRTAEDLKQLVPYPQLPVPFHTGHLAECLGVARWIAQRIAYCFRKAGTAQSVGKQGNTRLYVFAPPTPAAKRVSRRAA